MKRLATLALLLAVAAPVRGHFVWILPPQKAGQPARVVFSDGPWPDRPELLKKIASTELFFVDARGQTTPVKLSENKDAFDATLSSGAGAGWLGGICRYGVTQRGQAEPFLLLYYPKTVVGTGADGRAMHKALEPVCDKLPLQVVAGEGHAVRVLWQGKPLSGAEVAVSMPGQEKPVEGKTDANGNFALQKPAADGLIGIRVGHVENAAGELDGKKYKSVKHYATLTLPFDRALAKAGPSSNRDAANSNGTTQSEDPAATKLLADARAARANWENFPGFTADLEVNFDGKVEKGTVSVGHEGKVTINGLVPGWPQATAKVTNIGNAKVVVEAGDTAFSAWAKRMLGSIVGHRLDDGSDLHTPCAFSDDVTDHPLGRAIRVLNDEFHSSYRIRDKQVIEVNRVMKDTRFTITVLENRLNAKNKYLPATYVVNYWDLKTGALQRAEAHHQTWQFVGRYDLPLGATVVTSLPDKQETKSLKLTNIRLIGSDGNALK
jgi:hypothetical protein